MEKEGGLNETNLIFRFIMEGWIIVEGSPLRNSFNGIQIQYLEFGTADGSFHTARISIVGPNR